MKAGDVVEIEIDTVGVLRNPIAVGGSIATGPPSPRAVCPQGHNRVTICPGTLPWRQAGMSRSVEPAGPDLPPPRARGDATAGAGAAQAAGATDAAPALRFDGARHDTPVTLSDATRQQLEALGYAEPPPAPR
jgi:hypothetical protein